LLKERLKKPARYIVSAIIATSEGKVNWDWVATAREKLVVNLAHEFGRTGVRLSS
jgi:hypothetical protein